LQARILEFPAGTIDEGEDPATTVKRELEEEAGYRAHNWQSLGKFALAPGYSDEYIYAFLAQDLEKLSLPPAQDADEDIEVVFMSFEEMESAIARGESIDAKTITSFYLARLALN
jgi:ADP-ribose pyrophosphatase